MSETQKRRWIEFPIFVLEDEDGERAILPNDRQLKRMEERAEAAKVELDKRLAAGMPKNGPNGTEVAKSAYEYQTAALSNAKELTEKYRAESKVRPYLIAKPKFGFYIQAEESAKDWIDGQPRVDRSRFMIHLMLGNVQLEGNMLSEEGIRDMDVDEAPLVFEELEALCFPDPARIPFWSSRLKT